MRARRSGWLASGLVLFAACGGTQTDPPGAHADPRASASSDHTARTEASVEPEAPPREPPPPPPVVALLGESGAGGVDIVLQNRGASLARVAPALALEREGGSGFAVVEGVSLALRWSCEREAPACVELAPGAELRPPAWMGTLGDAQCACERCVPAEPGTYRFVARTCDGAHRLEGEPFTL